MIARSRAAATALVVSVALLLVLTGLVGERAVVALIVVGWQDPPVAGALYLNLGLYAGGVAALVVLFGVVWRRELTGVRGVTAVSTLGTLAFGALALLDLGFWSTARGAGAGETWRVGLVFFAVIAGPSVATLTAALVIFGRRGGREPRISRGARPEPR